MMNEKLIENLIAAKALIDTPDKWIKEGYGSECHRYCSMGAVRHILGGWPNDGHPRSSPEMQALVAELPESLGGSMDVYAVGSFNDHPDTTHADIMALFNRAIAAAEAAQ